MFAFLSSVSHHAARKSLGSLSVVFKDLKVFGCIQGCKKWCAQEILISYFKCNNVLESNRYVKKDGFLAKVENVVLGIFCTTEKLLEMDSFTDFWGIF